MTRITEALERRRTGLPEATTCFRWVDEELEGVTVDLFGDVAILSLYVSMSADRELALANELAAATPLRAVYVKRRPQEARTSGLSAEAIAPTTPLVGEAVAPFLVEELGAHFEIRPDNGLSVGLYLDSRDARRFLRTEARGRRILNTFAYTCGFSVAARLGGAARVANIDLSRKVLDWGAVNHAHNQLAVEPRDFISGDALEWGPRLAKKGERFDLIVLDPPGFAGSGKKRFSAQRDYHALVAAVAPLLERDGLLLAMCNVELMSGRDVEAQVSRGLGTRRGELVTRFGASSADYRQPGALKCQVWRVG